MFPSFVIYNFALSSRIITLKHVTFDGNELPLPYVTQVTQCLFVHIIEIEIYKPVHAGKHLPAAKRS
jgi:hypothetical protein